MQTVDPDEQLNQSVVSRNCCEVPIVLWVEHAITGSSLTLSPREEKSCATLTLPCWRKNSLIS